MHSSFTVAGALAATVLATLAAAVVATVTATIVASVAATHVRAYHDSSSPSFTINTDALCGAGIDALGQEFLRMLLSSKKELADLKSSAASRRRVYAISDQS